MPAIDSSMYVLVDGPDALIVDPCISADAEELLRGSGTSVCTVLLTHEHYDHISGVNRLRELFSCRVICSDACAQRICDPQKSLAVHFDALFMERGQKERRAAAAVHDHRYTCRADQTYSGCMELHWGKLAITLTETPGHSPGSQVICVDKHWYFTGDSMLPGQPVITRLPGGSRKEFETVAQPCLDAIRPGSVIFPGHGGPVVRCDYQ